MKILWTNYIQGMHTTIQFRILSTSLLCRNNNDDDKLNCTVGRTQAEVLEKRMLRKYLGLREMRLQKNGEDYITRSFTIYTPHQI
jgi:hypothetical protein